MIRSVNEWLTAGADFLPSPKSLPSSGRWWNFPLFGNGEEIYAGFTRCCLPASPLEARAASFPFILSPFSRRLGEGMEGKSIFFLMGDNKDLNCIWHLRRSNLNVQDLDGGTRLREEGRAGRALNSRSNRKLDTGKISREIYRRQIPTHQTKKKVKLILNWFGFLKLFFSLFLKIKEKLQKAIDSPHAPLCVVRDSPEHITLWRLVMQTDATQSHIPFNVLLHKSVPCFDSH